MNDEYKEFGFNYPLPASAFFFGVSSKPRRFEWVEERQLFLAHL